MFTKKLAFLQPKGINMSTVHKRKKNTVCVRLQGPIIRSVGGGPWFGRLYQPWFGSRPALPPR